MNTAHHFTPSPSKTYATRENAKKAVERVYGENRTRWPDSDLQYIIMTTEDNRYYPLFVGERAVQAQVFRHFCVMA